MDASASACTCANAAIVVATRRMVEHWRRLTAVAPRAHDWGVAVPAFAALLAPPAGAPPPAACAAHPMVWHAADAAELFLITRRPKIGMAHLKAVLEAAERLGLRRVHLVALHHITTQTQNLLPPDGRLTVVPWGLVLTQPLDHVLVPRHTRVAASEANGVRRGSLPMLRAGDPVAQYLGLRVGDVVRIDRWDDTEYFRLVVSDQ